MSAQFYHPLTLGIRRSEPATTNDRDKAEGRAQLNAWYEGPARIAVEYEEYPETEVLDTVRSLLPGAGRRLWVILGEPGAGKSTLLKTWFDRWARELPSPELGLPVPVLVPLRQLTPGDLDEDDGAVASRLWRSGIRSRARLDRLADAIYQPDYGPMFRLVWFLDGLDEVEGALRGERLYEQLVNLPGVKVVTCRSAVYEALRHETDHYKERQYEVLGLKTTEQQAFLKQALNGDHERSNDLFQKIQQNAAVRLLAGNPLLLTLIAEASNRTALPVTRAAFYQAAVEDMWSRKLANSEAEDLIEERDRVLTELARQMALDLEKVECNRRSLIQATNDVVTNKAEAKLLRDALERSGLLKVDRRRAVFSFVHLRTRQEISAPLGGWVLGEMV
jgi:hypothetical protein